MEKPLPENEYVASSIGRHDNSPEYRKHLLKTEDREDLSMMLLHPGMYYVNPLMFEVELDNVQIVQRGEVAVVVGNVGKEPDENMKAFLAKKLGKETLKANIKGIEERLDQGIEGNVVPAGYRGIQEEVSGPGIYYLNRRAFIPYIIKTTNIYCCWD